MLIVQDASNVTNDQYPLVTIRPRQFYGKEVKIGELKHHVFIKKLVNKWKMMYRAICSGNIITQERVLTSSHCFLTNRKKYRLSLKYLKVVGGTLSTYQQHPMHDSIQQWRSIKHVYSQKFYRFPAYNLAVVVVEKPWDFNQYVNKIPYASKDHDFDGICMAIAVRSVKSWSTSKNLFSEEFRMIKRFDCERTLLRSCRLYFCTGTDTSKLLLDSIESEGGGLICHGTGDPQEVNEEQGLLVGVTSLIYTKLPTLHHKVGLFHKWVTDEAHTNVEVHNVLMLFCLLIKLCIY
ncbi:coagulation factor IX-like [Ostrinia furnacalis]|uniref:coagulation factor IX-like n=1 Tax=Ostrinia furnacalis TaxID=93504 RepID=UPI00103F2CE2|nr:coagulation factor IX-like [Ostrinia furnacalis]